MKKEYAQPKKPRNTVLRIQKDAFAVMKAFGLNSRKPAVPEQKIMEKWFKDYGFDRELVLEACSRTINAIHTPSFQYADSILTDWKKAGVKTLADVKEWMPAGRNVPKMVLLSGFRVMETGQQHKITEKLPKISFTILNRGIQIMTP